MPLKSVPQSSGWLRAHPPLAVAGQRIGVMGGSFNPPHAGHVQIAHTALQRLGLDALWWVVTPGNPLKANAGLPPLADRMAAARALVHDPKIIVTGFESELGTPYTAATIAYLRRRAPDVHFVWVMGADNLAGFHRWQRWRDIAASVPIAVIDRPRFRLAAMASPSARAMARAYLPEARAGLLATRQAPAWTLLSGRLSPLSSTDLRAAKA
jgi:nicotinate-nucleotide adenylyltransferase